MKVIKKSERRKYPRFRISPQFRLKARIRSMGERETHYLEVRSLSMGGALLVAQQGVKAKIENGTTLEILCFSSSLSFRCVARVANHQLANLAMESDEKSPLCIKMGVEIVGIDEASRSILADFLARLSQAKRAIEPEPRVIKIKQ